MSMDWKAAIYRLTQLKAQIEALAALDDDEMEAAIPTLLVLSEELLVQVDDVLAHAEDLQRSS
jgi:hypothetical protein